MGRRRKWCLIAAMARASNTRLIVAMTRGSSVCLIIAMIRACTKTNEQPRTHPSPRTLLRAPRVFALLAIAMTALFRARRNLNDGTGMFGHRDDGQARESERNNRPTLRHKGREQSRASERNLNRSTFEQSWESPDKPRSDPGRRLTAQA